MTKGQALFLLPAAVAVFLGSASAEAPGKFKLRPDVKGKVCLNCHVAFREILKRPFLHTPVKSGECWGCHNPHTSSHAKLLEDESNRLCFRCHKTVLPGKARSVHAPVAEGKCVPCHDPHASNEKFVLVKAGSGLCFGCHKELQARAATVKFKHPPVEKGCLTCHSSHASAASGALLVRDVPTLCLGCHRSDRPDFAKRHMNYPVGASRCTSCHDVHGSMKAGMLFDTVHKPVTAKMCTQCHEEASPSRPLAVKKAGYELCRGCHSALVDEAFGKNQIHWPLLSSKGCLSCHTPHASAGSGLLKGTQKRVCGSCHEDSVARQERSQTKHEPVREGTCTLCHSPHASDSALLLAQPSVIDLCGTCHDWQKHVTHPVGEKVTDPRDKNLTVDCLSCHRAHGTEYKSMIPFPTITDLCIQCHREYRR